VSLPAILAQNSEHSDKKSLTMKNQQQRRQCGVALQRVTQRLRSFIADFIAYRHTRVERSEYEISKPVPMGDAVRKVIATSALHTLVALIVVLHNRLATVQPVVLHTYSNKTKPETHITKKTTHLPNSATMRVAWCCPSKRQPKRSLLLDRFYFLAYPYERFKHRFSKPIQMGSAANRQPQQ
jgi:hypothetical protein